MFASVLSSFSILPSTRQWSNSSLVGSDDWFEWTFRLAQVPSEMGRGGIYMAQFMLSINLEFWEMGAIFQNWVNVTTDPPAFSNRALSSKYRPVCSYSACFAVQLTLIVPWLLAAISTFDSWESKQRKYIGRMWQTLFDWISSGKVVWQCFWLSGICINHPGQSQFALHYCYTFTKRPWHFTST